MSRYQFTIIFDSLVSLNCGRCKIPNHGNQCTDATNYCIFYHRSLYRGSIDYSQKSSSDNSTDTAFYRFLRTEYRCHLVLANEHSHTIRTGIASPGAKENQPDNKFTIRKIPCQKNKRQHYCHINHTEKRRHYLMCIIFRICKHINKHDQNQ